MYLYRKREGSLLLSEFECPRTILIKQQQQQQHHIFFMDVPAPARSFSLFHPTQQLEDVHAPFVFKILLICFNDIDCIDYYLFQKEKLGKKMLPSTWYPRVDISTHISSTY